MQATRIEAEILQAVLDELRWDSRVDAAHIGVEVDGGAVVLSGAVASFAARIAAREAAHRVAGVLDVVDELRVALPHAENRTDADLAHAVRRALTWDALVPEERIQSTIMDGHVTLRGEVDTLSERSDAERAVRDLRGVRGVLNEIRIAGAPIEANAIRSSIERALERRAVRDSKHLAVRIKDGEVTISGEVPSYSEQQAVLEAAAHAPGVRSVKNGLHVDLFA